MNGAQRNGRTIVCGLDESNEAREALRVAAELKDGLGARLLLVHVEPPPSTAPGASVAPDVEKTLRRAETIHGERLLEELVASQRLNGSVERRVEFGSPAQVLVDVAKRENADLLVVGCRGRGPVTGALFGSVSAGVLRDAPCPVVVSRGHAGERA